MKPITLALLAASALAPACAWAQTNTFTDVTVNPMFTAVLSQPPVPRHSPLVARLWGSALL